MALSLGANINSGCPTMPLLIPTGPVSAVFSYLLAGVLVEEPEDCELRRDGLAAARRCAEQQIIVRVVGSVEDLRLHGIEVLDLRIQSFVPRVLQHGPRKDTESVCKKSAFKNASAFALGSSIKVVAND